MKCKARIKQQHKNEAINAIAKIFTKRGVDHYFSEWDEMSGSEQKAYAIEQIVNTMRKKIRNTENYFREKEKSELLEK